MNEDDIAKLASQLTQSLATKDDIQLLRGDLKRLENKIDEIDHKADTILNFADEIEKETDNLGKRVTKIEAVPSIAHEINK